MEVQTIMKRLRRYFVTGLVIILPIWASINIMLFLVKFIGSLTRPFFEVLLIGIIGMKHIEIFMRVISFLSALVLICAIGFLVSFMLGRRVFSKLEALFLRVPLLKEIYLAVKRLVTFFLVEKRKYRSVVLVEYPRKGLYAIGFVTSDASIKKSDNFITVFVPTTPNPTSGMLLVVNKSDVIHLNMSIEDALKLVVSGGIISPKVLE